MKQLVLTLIFVMISFSAFGQIAESPNKLTAKGYRLYSDATKLDAATLESILDFDAFTDYEKVQRMKKAAYWLGGLGLLELGCGGVSIALASKEGKVDLFSYGLTALGGAMLIGGAVVGVVGQGKLQTIASEYNRKSRLAFSPTANGVGVVYRF